MASHEELCRDMMSDQLTRYCDVKYLFASLAQEVVMMMLIGLTLKSHAILDALTDDSVDRCEANFRSER